MKKLFGFFFLAVCAVSLSAAETNSAAQPETQASPYDYSMPVYDSWTPLQIGLFPQVPSYQSNSHVCGIKTGWPMCAGYGIVDGFESSWLYSGTDYVNGLQASLFMNDSKHLRGFSPAMAINLNRGTLEGHQATCLLTMGVNVVGLQSGCLNLAKNICGAQVAAIANISRQTDAVQVAPAFNVARELNGGQAGIVNVARDVDGFQFGLVNVIGGETGVQIGLINIIADGTVPFLPFFVSVCKEK